MKIKAFSVCRYYTVTAPIGYDLRIGAAYSPREFNNTHFEDGTEFMLLPGHSLQILCKEFIWLSPFIIASIHSRGSFAAKGLILNSTTIDPNWSGPMALALYNASSTPYIVKSFFLENQGFFSVSSINISEEGAIGMDISLYLVRK